MLGGIAFAAMVALFASAPAAEAQPVEAVAIVTINNDPGGDLMAYVRGWRYIAATGARVEIGGYCVSACTAVLGLVPAGRVCVRAGATFGFHSVSVNYGPHSEAGTRYLWSLYPEHVQDALRKAGWDGASGARHDLILIAGTAFYPFCAPSLDFRLYMAAFLMSGHHPPDQDDHPT
jgi:hypothetical protein